MTPDERTLIVDEHRDMLWGRSSATFAVDRRYRYELTRTWADPEPGIEPSTVFVMLNPSTADAFTLDPTLTRCARYARDWGSAGMKVYNIYAHRSTNPRMLYEAADPVGLDNDRFLAGIDSDDCHRLVVGWGAHGALHERGRTVADMFRRQGRTMWCFGHTKTGHPMHPLYLPRDAQLGRYARPSR